MDKKISVVGDCSTDHFLMVDARDAGIIQSGSDHKKICFNFGEKLPVRKTETFFGGSALNVAVSLSSLGVDTELISFLGSDMEAHEIMGFLHSKNIETGRIILDQKTNQSFVIIFDDERTVLSNHLTRTYSRLKLPKSDYIYLASAGEGSDDLINKIRAEVTRGARLVFNPGSYILRNFDLFKSLLAITSVLIINKVEAELIFGNGSITSQLEKILANGTKIAVITDAQNGAYFGSMDKFYHMHAFTSEVKDPTGAGDGFAGAFTAGIVLGKTLEESARWGMVNSASVIEKKGANTGVLNFDEIEKKLERNKSLKFSSI